MLFVSLNSPFLLVISVQGSFPGNKSYMELYIQLEPVVGQY